MGLYKELKAITKLSLPGTILGGHKEGIWDSCFAEQPYFSRACSSLPHSVPPAPKAAEWNLAFLFPSAAQPALISLLDDHTSLLTVLRLSYLCPHSHLYHLCQLAWDYPPLPWEASADLPNQNWALISEHNAWVPCNFRIHDPSTWYHTCMFLCSPLDWKLLQVRDVPLLGSLSLAHKQSLSIVGWLNELTSY